ncbi:MAG: lamin tail domain-containing protein [Akkermansiaceae bacterium]
MLRLSLLAILALPFACGDVIINEISASQSERLLRWDENNQPFVGPGPAWWSPGFDASDWKQGNMPAGYSLGSIATNLSADLLNTSPSFFARKTFNAPTGQASSGQDLILRINFNDGFIAWLNGVEIARENMGEKKAHIYHDQLSYRSAGSSTAVKDFNLGPASGMLKTGENLLAVQINNYSLSGNMRLDMALLINGSSTLFGQGTTISFLPGLSEPTADLSEPALPGSGSSDWIELHNTGSETVDLSGWSLTDDESDTNKWPFPAGTLIAPNDFLLVLADNPDSPIPESRYLHANFKLSSSGEFLGLFAPAGLPRSQINPEFPKQFLLHSYGTTASGSYAFHALPTPGSPNSPNPLDSKVDAPDFDQKGGFYDNPLTLALTSETPGAIIRYTTNGTEPTMTNGLTFTAPLNLGVINSRKGHVIRARAFKDGLLPSSIKTHSFLIGQDSRVRSSPALVYAGDPQRSLYDPFGVLAINGGAYVGNRWEPRGPFDYNNSINRGRAYERPIHAEFYFPDGRVGFRSDVGVRIAASSWSRPRMTLNQTSSSPWPDQPKEKPSFNLYFRDDYGNPSVNLPLNGPDHPINEYERFRLRAGKNDIRNPFVIDELIRRLSRDMGQGASIGIINSLYVNGELKGFYNMVERLREPFFRSLHQSENGAQWDVLQFEGNDNIAEGDKVAWNDMISRLNATTTVANWDRVLEVADVVNMADYYLLNIYCATWDWPHNNWVAAKERSTEGRYRLYIWDAEGAMNNKGNRPISQEMITSFIATGSGELRDLWRGLRRWPEFRLLFADRIHKHMFHGGVLDDRDYENSHLKSEFDKLVNEFKDLLSLMNGQSVNTVVPLAWANQSSGRRRYLLGPNREDFRTHDLWPQVAPPTLSRHGGSVADNLPLIMTSDEGEIYFTVDGSDPRLPGGTPNPAAIMQSGKLSSEDIVPLGSTWSFSDTDGDLGSSWRDPGFDDSLWPAGPGPLGYGSIRDTETGKTHPIATAANRRNGQPTTYFRHTFEVDNPSSFLDLTLTIRVDGGALVYLNGLEIHRDSNLPEVVDYTTTPASDASDGNEGDLDSYPIDLSFLQQGTNVIAIELHNRTANSDMVIDAQLSGKRTAPDNPAYPVTSPFTIMARTLHNGTWSALTTADFTVETTPADQSNLAIAEFLYNPIGASPEEEAAGFDDGDLFEFLRIENTGDQVVDLNGVRFTRGITFDFSDFEIRTLAPGGVALIVSDLVAFRFRYGAGFDEILAGQYSGRLSNEGETLRLIGQSGEVIHEFQYGITSPWPDLSTLDGHSLEIIDQGADHSLSSNWQPSSSIGGLPGGLLGFQTWRVSQFNPAQLDDEDFSGPDADPDGDSWSNFWEFALGTDPQDRGNFPPPFATGIESIESDTYLTLTFFTADHLRKVDFAVELSENLSDWSAGGVRVLPDLEKPDGTRAIKFRHPMPQNGQKQFLRLKASN